MFRCRLPLSCSESQGPRLWWGRNVVQPCKKGCLRWPGLLDKSPPAGCLCRRVGTVSRQADAEPCWFPVHTAFLICTAFFHLRMLISQRMTPIFRKCTCYGIYVQKWPWMLRSLQTRITHIWKNSVSLHRLIADDLLCFSLCASRGFSRFS